MLCIHMVLDCVQYRLKYVGERLKSQINTSLNKRNQALLFHCNYVYCTTNIVDCVSIKFLVLKLSFKQNAS